MSKVVQLSLSEKEYAELNKRANEEGVSLTFFIKSRMFEDTEFQRFFRVLLTRVNSMEGGKKLFLAPFSIKMILNDEWLSISKGVRLSLGRAFYDYVVAGNVQEVVAAGKDSARTQLYTKGVVQ